MAQPAARRLIQPRNPARAAPVRHLRCAACAFGFHIRRAQGASALEAGRLCVPVADCREGPCAEGADTNRYSRPGCPIAHQITAREILPSPIRQ